MTEAWRPIPYPGFSNYEVSDLGRVRSKARMRACGKRWLPERYLGYVDPRRGYLFVTLHRDGGPSTSDSMKRFQVHVLVLRAFAGPPPPGCEGRHLDRNPSNAALSNLAWGTHAENEADKRVHGTAIVGDRNHATKLSVDDVAAIRVLASSGAASQRQLARQFGVSQPHVGRIARGEDRRA